MPEKSRELRHVYMSNSSSVEALLDQFDDPRARYLNKRELGNFLERASGRLAASPRDGLFIQSSKRGKHVTTNYFVRNFDHELRSPGRR